MPGESRINSFRPTKYRRRRVVEWRIVKKAGVWFFIIVLSGASIAYRDIQWKHPYAYIEVIRIDGTSKTYRIVKPDPNRPLSSEEIDSITHKLLVQGPQARVAGHPVEPVSTPALSGGTTQQSEPVEPESSKPAIESTTTTTIPQDNVNIPDEKAWGEEPVASWPEEGDLRQVAAGVKVNANIRSLLGLPEVAQDAEKLWMDPQTPLADLDPSTVALIGAFASDDGASAALLRTGDSRLQALVLKAAEVAPPDRKVQPVEKIPIMTKVKRWFGFGDTEEPGERPSAPVSIRSAKLESRGVTPYKSKDKEQQTTVPDAASIQGSGEQERAQESSESQSVNQAQVEKEKEENPDIPGRNPVDPVNSAESRKLPVSEPDTVDKGLLALDPSVKKLVSLPEVRRDARKLRTNPKMMLADLDPSTVALIGTLIMNRDAAAALLNSKDPDLQALAQKAKEYSSNA